MAMRAIKAAIADGLLTFMWIFCTSSLDAATYVVASSLDVSPGGLPTLFVITFLLFVLLFLFGIIGDLFGGATFNPTVGGDADSLVSSAIRFPAQNWLLAAMSTVIVAGWLNLYNESC
ncbi:hypothetical protein ACJIZ3_017211 [Penstemon smallii]|uniref:Uncharacterized protein n=1 Tax=Penstemon smallii TaxID=265156 RepID=A0ABD3SUX1_9LAMI